MHFTFIKLPVQLQLSSLFSQVFEWPFDTSFTVFIKMYGVRFFLYRLYLAGIQMRISNGIIHTLSYVSPRALPS